MVERLSAGLLGRHVGNRSHRSARRGELVHADGSAGLTSRNVGDAVLEGELCQTEVEDFRLPARADKDVRGLDVAVDDSAGVGGVESIGNLNTQLQQLFKLERTAFNLVFEGRAVQILHGDESFAVLLANVIDGADIGMVQGGSGLGLTLKPAEGLRIFGYVFGKEFQGDEAVQPRVFGFVDNTHSATTQAFNDAVVRNGLAYHGPSGDGLTLCRDILGGLVVAVNRVCTIAW